MNHVFQLTHLPILFHATCIHIRQVTDHIVQLSHVVLKRVLLQTMHTCMEIVFYFVLTKRTRVKYVNIYDLFACKEEWREAESGENEKKTWAKGNSVLQMCNVKKQGKHWCMLMFLTEKHWGNNKPDIAHHKVPLQIQILQLSESAKFRLTQTQSLKSNTHTKTKLKCKECDAGLTACLESAC